MTISNTSNRKEYTGDGATVAFATSPVVFFAEGDLTVYKVTTATGAATLQVLTTDYTVSGGSGSTGTVTMVVAPTAAQTLVIVRELDLVQEVDFVNNEATDAEVSEDALDKLTLMVQQLSAKQGRALALADSDVTGVSTALPTPVAGKSFAWNTGLTALETVDSPAGAVAAAAASAAAAAVSETNAATSASNASTSASNASTSASNASTSETNAAASEAAAAASAAAAAAGANNDVPVELLHIDYDTGHRDLIADGWMPAFFNQQWGGAPHYFELVDGATGVPYRFEAATGYWDGHDTGAVFGYDTTYQYLAQPFKVSQATTLPDLWLRLYKNGNPTDNIQVTIYSDSAGAPNAAITNGSATALSMKQVPSGAAAGNVSNIRFVFPTPPSLSANTTYWIVITRSGANSATDYCAGLTRNVATYPHGKSFKGTSVPAWAAYPSATSSLIFLITAPAAAASLQTGGTFSDGKLQFFEGSPLNQSNGRVKDLKDFRGLDLTDFTLLVRGSDWTKDKTVLDITYGLDHDRIVLRSNATTGYAQVDVYEKSGTKHTVTATSVDLSSGDHDVAIRVQAKGDGSDTVALYVDGAANGTAVTAATIDFDALFGLAQIGTMWIGGGFAVAPTWTADLDMSVLPSAATPAWTWTGTATEANAMSVSGGKLYQNYGGYTSTQTGHYTLPTLSLSNTNGWGYVEKGRVTRSPNTKGQSSVNIVIDDGTKSFQKLRFEYYAEMYNAGSIATPQADFKSADQCSFIIGKGSDVYTFLNGRLELDGTGQNTAATASNQLRFGDFSATAGENADAVYDYVKYYNTAWLPPQFTSGSLSELAIWNGDQTSILATLYGGGTEVSVKTYAGVEKNWVGEEVVQRITQHAITPNPTFTATNLPNLSPEMEAFVVGSNVHIAGRMLMANNADQNSVYQWGRIDGGPIKHGPTGGDWQLGGHVSGNNGQLTAAAQESVATLFGLHKAELHSTVGANTGMSIYRTIGVEARA